MYQALLSNSDKAPGYSAGRITKEVPSEYQNAFDEANTQKMTQLAKKILKND